MRPVLASLAPILAALALLSAACGSGGPSDADVLISLADEVAVPAFQAVAEDMARLDEATQSVCQNPDDISAEAARQAWYDARASWMASEAMWFGPVMERRSRSLLDWSPTDIDGIEELLAQRRVLTATDIRETLASNQRGFGAMEYVLFDKGTTASPEGYSPRCAFLSALTSAASQETDAILSAWVEGDGGSPYRDYLTGRSGVALLASEAVAEVVRTQIFLIRDIVDMRLASALGLRDGGADPSAIPGTAADNGLEDLRNELQGMRRIYEGAGPRLGISALVRPLSEDTDQRLRQQLADALGALDAVEGPLRVAIAERPSQVNEAYDRLAELQRTMATELVSLLGVSVGFTDTDGDSLR